MTGDDWVGSGIRDIEGDKKKDTADQPYSFKYVNIQSTYADLAKSQPR